jgi:phage tail-like protein
MAVSRQYPYNQFNFQVKFGSTQASFQEVSGLGMEIHVMEYRSGDRPDNSPIKVTGLTKYNDLTFKRGVCGDLTTLYAWFASISGGAGNAPNGGVTVTINLMDDTNTTAVQTWTANNARATKLTGPTPLNGKATDVAIEELVVICEGITQS